MSGQSPSAIPSQWQIKLHSPPVDFIQNHLPQYHPAFDVHTAFQYDPSQVRFIPLHGHPFPAAASAPPHGMTMYQPPPPALSPTFALPHFNATSNLQVPQPGGPGPRPTPVMINEMTFWDKIFPLAMLRLNVEPEPRGDAILWGIRRETSWRNVQAKLEMAQREYEFMHDQKDVGRFRRTLRKGLDSSAVPLQQGVKLIPSSDVTSPVIGVVNMLLDAYCQSAEVREKVSSGFDDLPSAFVKMDFYFNSYPNDENIIKASVELVLATFKAIEEAIGFFTSRQASRAGRAVLNGKEYEKVLLMSLSEIQRQLSALESQANMSLTHHILSDGEQRRQFQVQLLQKSMETQQAMGMLLEVERAGKVWFGNLLNTVLSFMADSERNGPQWSPLPSRPNTPSHIPTPLWTLGDVWNCLQIPDLEEADLQTMLDSTADIFPEDQGRVEQVLNTGFFRHWISSPLSSKLLIHGDFAETGTIKSLAISPLSILCATVMHALRAQHRVVTTSMTISLAFFCGTHTLRDEYHGAQVMIRTMIAQLLRQFPFSTIDPGPSFPSLNDIHSANTSQLCSLFTTLIRQLPPRTTVYCIIDGIHEYETAEFLHGMDEVILMLIELAEQHLDDGIGFGMGGRGNVRLKLLLTSPWPTVEVRKAFDDAEGELLHMVQMMEMQQGHVDVLRMQERAGEAMLGEGEET